MLLGLGYQLQCGEIDDDLLYTTVTSMTLHREASVPHKSHYRRNKESKFVAYRRMQV